MICISCYLYVTEGLFSKTMITCLYFLVQLLAMYWFAIFVITINTKKAVMCNLITKNIPVNITLNILNYIWIWSSTQMFVKFGNDVKCIWHIKPDFSEVITGNLFQAYFLKGEWMGTEMRISEKSDTESEATVSKLLNIG